MRSSQGINRTASGENDIYAAPIAAWAGGVRGVIYCHGAGTLASNIPDYNSLGEMHVYNDLAERYPTLVVDAGGANNWGNATSVARIGDAVTHLQGASPGRNAKSGTVLMIGASMGFLTAMNYAKANPTKVGCIVGLLPVLDLNDFVTNNRGGFASAINTAYGGAYIEATHGPTSNPYNYRASITTPMQIYTASDDPWCIPSIATAFDSAVASCTQYDVGALSHTQAAIDAANRTQILSFLSTYA
jgi:S-formylglutathione hydrolase FrmB